MEKKKVRLLLGGIELNLTTTDDAAYLKRLGDEVDDCLTDIKRENPRYSLTRAALVCALRFADEMHKAHDATNALRKEIQAYMEDASKAKTDAEISRREAERISRELAALKAERRQDTSNG